MGHFKNPIWFFQRRRTNVSRVDTKLQTLCTRRASRDALELRSKGFFAKRQQMSVALANAQLGNFLWRKFGVRRNEQQQGAFGRQKTSASFPNLEKLIG